MIRLLVILLALIVLVTVLRYFVGFAARAVANFLEAPPDRPPSPGKGHPKSASTLGGELKRDPVCGTFVAAGSAIRRKSGSGQILYFCSEECVRTFERSQTAAS
jgi:YHS domain-containing protein